MALRNEFVPFDCAQRSRNKLRKLVSSYRSEFRNIVLTIPEVSEGEKIDRFCHGLKPQIRFEVLKTGPQTMEAAARTALNVDSALFGARMLSFQGHGSSVPGQRQSGPTPMEIGNVEKKNVPVRHDEMRSWDLKNNACFTCHKVGCRPHKHKRGVNRNKGVKFTNLDVNGDDGPGGAEASSENLPVHRKGSSALWMDQKRVHWRKLLRRLSRCATPFFV